MSSSNTDNWAATRNSFADQFEQDGSNFIYRRSQKGEAIRVSAEERTRFIDEFNRSLRRGMWMMYIGLALTLGGAVLFSVLRGSDLSQAALFAGMAIVMVPYFAYVSWVWGAPARELAGRTPIAVERSPGEVRRLRFQRITYGQLGIAALAGLAIPLFGSARQEVLSGWNRLWLAFGGGLVLFVAIQAFRKWRFEQEESLRNVIPRFSNPVVTDVAQDAATSQTKAQPWRYVPFAIIVLGFAFVAFTPAGKRLAQTPSFWPIMMIGLGGWSLFTVTQGFAKGRIEPIVRGLHNTYQREKQPKRFWASMTWNALLGGFFLWAAFSGLRDGPQQAVQDRCYNQHDKFTSQEAFDACTQLIEGKTPLGYLSKGDAFVYRAISEQRSNRAQAIADYTQAIRLQPDDGDAYFSRGLLLLNSGRPDDAIADFSRAYQLNPKNIWPLANRGLAYALTKDSSRAKTDFRVVEASDKSNPVMLRGRAVLSINSLNMTDAVNYLTASLKSDPDNVWAVRTRAWAFRQLGDDEHADADIKRYERLSGRPAFSNEPGL